MKLLWFKYKGDNYVVIFDNVLLASGKLATKLDLRPSEAMGIRFWKTIPDRSNLAMLPGGTTFVDIN